MVQVVNLNFLLGPLQGEVGRGEGAPTYLCGVPLADRRTREGAPESFHWISERTPVAGTPSARRAPRRCPGVAPPRSRSLGRAGWGGVGSIGGRVQVPRGAGSSGGLGWPGPAPGERRHGPFEPTDFWSSLRSSHHRSGWASWVKSQPTDLPRQERLVELTAGLPRRERQ